MGAGFLTVQAHTADDALPVARAHVVIKSVDGVVLYDTYTDENGNTTPFSLAAPDAKYTLDPHYNQPAYAVCDVDVSAEGFVTKHIHNVQIVDTQTTILPVDMQPLLDEANPPRHEVINLPPIALLIPSENRQAEPPPAANGQGSRLAALAGNGAFAGNGAANSSPGGMVNGMAIGAAANPADIGADPAIRGRSVPVNTVIIPEYITVHLGQPNNAGARNVRVKFVDYIKNVTSSEIYSTWPDNSIAANVHVIVTFALNRVYTEWYRSRGFNFDITNSTSYDQFYREGGPIFASISRIVDGIFNVYARRIGFRNPFFTQFCNGTTATCPGLSQWGTVTLANQGMTPLQILHYFYPDDLELVESNNITGITETFPGYALSVGSQGNPVLRMQNFLNRIRVNFPLIPRISNPNGVFGTDTENAVRTFQRTFNLTADGVIGRNTWNKINFIYVGVVRMAELDAEGERAGVGTAPPNVVLSQGSRGEHVILLQFILNAISPYYNSVPQVIKDGVFDTVTKNAVIEFQKTFGLTRDGIVGPGTWNKLYAVYRGIQNNAPVPPVVVVPPSTAPAFPGTPLRSGSSGSDVRLMQTYLNMIRIVYPSIPYVVVDGMFGPRTEQTVIAFQREFVLTPDGVIGPVTWDKIVSEFMLVTGNASVSLEFPGTALREGSTGPAVRLMQNFLSDLRARYPSLPAVTVDGIFGPRTKEAVMAFQRIAGLTPDGIIGPATWNAIVSFRNAS